MAARRQLMSDKGVARNGLLNVSLPGLIQGGNVDRLVRLLPLIGAARENHMATRVKGESGGRGHFIRKDRGITRGDVSEGAEDKSVTTEGKAKILYDDCKVFGFEVDRRRFEFEKRGHESWIETVKNSARTGRKISVTDEQDAPPPFTPTDIHDI